MKDPTGDPPRFRPPRRSFVYCVLLASLLSLGMDYVSAHVKLNVPRVRLPYFESLSVNFTLQVDTPGCYRWTTSPPDVITISTTNGVDFEQDGDGTTGCSDTAVISTIPRVSPCCPANAIVYAEEVNTKEIVRCDVIIDKLTSVSIVTTTKELHLEEAPSKFHVRGTGGKGNEFSTLEGVPFKWWLETPTAVTSSVTDPQSVMRFLPFSESLYNTPASITALEARRLQGSQVLVEGLKTGSANVFAKIHDPFYKNIAPAEVRIVVVANLLLEPHEVYVVPESTFLLKLLQVKHGKIHEISLPSDVYSFEITNETVATYDRRTSTITTLTYGETKILVKDKNNLEDIEGEHPEPLTSYIYVREPRFISLTIKPYKNWALMIGQQYEISVDVFDSDNQRILVGDNMFIRTTFESNFFRTDLSSSNGSYHVGTPIKTGSARVNAVLEHIKKTDGSLLILAPAPRVQVEMEIFQRIALNPKQSVLPWDPNLQMKHEIQFNPSGGNGNYAWSTTNSSVVTVTQSGQASTDIFGYANVTAAMTINSNIKGHAKVYVLPPTSMKILDHIVEAEVGTAILVPLAFYTIRPDDPTKTPVPYSTCRKVQFKVGVDDPNFYYDSKTHYPHAKPACVYLPVVGNKLGSTLVTVTYSVGDLSFTDSVTVSTFKPLKVVEPRSAVTVLAVGSSRQLVFQGGPRPLLERASEFSRQMNIENSTVAKSIEIKTHHAGKDDMYIYEVFCTEIGETLATLETGNSKYSEDRRPVSRTADVKVVCGEPAKIYFKVETKIREDGGSRCPHDLSTAQVVRVPVPNYENTLVSVTVKDPKGRKFDNISSLAISWTSSEQILDFKNTKFIETEVIPVNGYSIPGNGYQTIVPRKMSGSIQITAEVIGYRTEALSHYKIFKNMKLSVLHASEEYLYQRSMSMDLELVADVSIDPPSATLFNHKSSKTVLKILEGSGYFEVHATPNLIVNLKYFENNKTIVVVPLTEGEARIIVKDLCLAGRPTAEVGIKVNGVGTIELDVVDKIQVSHEVIVNVLLYDKNGKHLTPKDLSYIQLRPTSLTTELLEVEPIFRADSESLNIQYKVKAKRVGLATLGFIADGPGRVSKSAIKRITVFPPLTVDPENITLLAGSLYQILPQGGPQDALISYSSGAADKAVVTVSGLIQGRSLGSSRVEVKSIDRDSATSEIVYSEASVDVQVINLSSIRIHAPLTRIQVQKDMPLWAVGLQGGSELEPPVLLGGVSPIGSCQWDVSNKEVAEIIHVFQPYGLTTSRGDQVEVRLRAKQPGKVIVKLTTNFSGVAWSDEIDIQVLEELKFVNLPNTKHQTLLMTPNSELNLKTNRDASAVVSYAVHPVNALCGGQPERDNEGPTISVDGNGIVRTGEVSGPAVIVVTVREAFGFTQTISLPVEVRPISYLMINPELPVRIQSQDKLISRSLPRGVSLPFSISYHDNLGRTFDATRALPKVRPNRFDVAHVTPGIENHTFSAQLVNVGRAVVKVYDAYNPNLKDFLVLNVQEAIYPKMPMDVVIVGDVICFDCAVKSPKLREGYWTSDPLELLFIDSVTGLGVATAPGKARIEYHITGIGVVTSVDLEIRGVNRIAFQTGALPEYITNGNEDSVYEFPVKIGDKVDNLLGSNCNQELFGENVPAPFICQLKYENDQVTSKVSDTFTVKPVFNYDEERYACQISRVAVSNSRFHVSTIRSKLVLTVQMKHSTVDTSKPQMLSHEQLTVGSLPLSIPFTPAVFIHSDTLQIVNREQSNMLSITGLTSVLNQLVFVPSDGSCVEIDKRGTSINPFVASLVPVDQIVAIDKIPEGSETRSYKIRVLPNYWFSGNFLKPLSISLISPVTKQTIRIPVIVSLVPGGGLGRTSNEGLWGLMHSILEHWHLWFVGPAVGTLITLLIVLLLWKSYSSTQTNGKATSQETIFLTTTPAQSKTSSSPRLRSLRNPTNFSPSSLTPSQGTSGMGDSFASSFSSGRLYSTQDGYSPYRGERDVFRN